MGRILPDGKTRGKGPIRPRAGDGVPRWGEFSPTGKPEAKGRSAQKAAELMKVSDFSVKAADRVKKQGVPQLVDALAAGRVSVWAAARIAGLPPKGSCPWFARYHGKMANSLDFQSKAFMQ